MVVAPNVVADFQRRLEQVVALIDSYEIPYEEIGIFGSYARKEYKATSDIDVCILSDCRPNRRVSGELREEAELLQVDIIFVTPKFLEESQEPLAIQLRKDYRRVR